MPESQDPTTAQRIDRIRYDCAMRTASERHSDGSTICNTNKTRIHPGRANSRIGTGRFTCSVCLENAFMAIQGSLGLFMAQTDGAKWGIGAAVPRVFGMGGRGSWNGEGWLIYFVCYWNQAVLSSESFLLLYPSNVPPTALLLRTGYKIGVTRTGS